MGFAKHRSGIDLAETTSGEPASTVLSAGITKRGKTVDGAQNAILCSSAVRQWGKAVPSTVQNDFQIRTGSYIGVNRSHHETVRELRLLCGDQALVQTALPCGFAAAQCGKALPYTTSLIERPFWTGPGLCLTALSRRPAAEEFRRQFWFASSKRRRNCRLRKIYPDSVQARHAKLLFKFIQNSNRCVSRCRLVRWHDICENDLRTITGLWPSVIGSWSQSFDIEHCEWVT